MSAKPEPVSEFRSQTGENPLWDPAHECLYWTDIPSGRLYKFESRTRKSSCIYEGPPVGGFTQEADGTLLLFRVHDIARFYPHDGNVRPIIEFPHDGAERFNDVIADPEGRVFAGRLSPSKENGGLWRIDTDGSVHRLFTGCATPNGMGFSPDLKTFYYTCTTPDRTIFRFRYDRTTGEISDRETVYKTGDSEGKPDGLSIDADGNLWSARFGGSSVVKHSPDGKILARISLPVPKVTSVAFGGPSMDTLFITTAGAQPDQDTLDGTLFTLPAPIQGRLEFRSKILLD